MSSETKPRRATTRSRQVGGLPHRSRRLIRERSADWAPSRERQRAVAAERQAPAPATGSLAPRARVDPQSPSPSGGDDSLRTSNLQPPAVLFHD
jgi:hypothetical protein